MYTVLFNTLGVAVAASAEPVVTESWQRAFTETRHNWKSLDRVNEIAQQLTLSTDTPFIGVDNGPYLSPRFDIIREPQIGDSVSRYFNGDSYIEGQIIKISASKRRIETSTGLVFWRKRQTAAWINNGTWILTNGHHESRNPSF